MKSIVSHKEDIYNEVLRQYVDWYGEEHQGAGTCAHWAMTGGLVFQRHGIRALLQAGTMLWPAFDDDGVHDTHFGYEWNPAELGSKVALRLGMFPEIHVWLAIPKAQEIVDFSVRHLPECAARDGKVWTKPTPPPFLWVTKDELPDGVIYRPEIPAMNWLLSRLQKDGHVKVNRPCLDISV